MIEEQIASALETVLPDHTWPVILPQNPQYPAVTYHRLDYEQKSDQWSLNPLQLRSAEGPRSLFQIVIYAHPYTRCAELLREVKAALEMVPGLILDSVQDGFEFEQDVFAIITEWAIWGDLETKQTGRPGDWPLVQPFAFAILDDLVRHFDKRVSTIRFHDPSQRPLETPALILDMDNVDIGESSGDDRIPANMHWVIHCLLPMDTDNPELQVRGMAAEVFARVHFNKWGLAQDVDFPENLSAEQGNLYPGLFGHNHWRVRWDQTGYLVLEDSTEPPFLPEDCYSSFEPATGEDFESEYEELEPTCETPS